MYLRQKRLTVTECIGSARRYARYLTHGISFNSYKYRQVIIFYPHFIAKGTEAQINKLCCQEEVKQYWNSNLILKSIYTLFSILICPILSNCTHWALVVLSNWCALRLLLVIEYVWKHNLRLNWLVRSSFVGLMGWGPLPLRGTGTGKVLPTDHIL